MVKVPFRPITVRSAVPFRKLSYSCKIRNETQSFRSAVPEIIPTRGHWVCFVGVEAWLTSCKHAIPHMLSYFVAPFSWDMGGGVAYPLEPRFSITCVTIPNRYYSTSKHTSVIEEDLPDKNRPSRPAIQGHSWSLERTRIDRLPMTSY